MHGNGIWALGGSPDGHWLRSTESPGGKFGGGGQVLVLARSCLCSNHSDRADSSAVHGRSSLSSVRSSRMVVGAWRTSRKGSDDSHGRDEDRGKIGKAY